MDAIQTAMMLSASGMRVQGDRIKIIAQNIANADSVAKEPGGDPYRRQLVTFKNSLDRELGAKRVEVDRIKDDMSDFKLKFAPNHPAADGNGYIKLPNVNTLIETQDLRESQRSYEANLGVIQSSRSMLAQTIDLLR